MHVTLWIAWMQEVDLLLCKYLFSTEISIIEREIDNIQTLRLLSTNLFVSNMKLQELN
jgi:hypothetical protein